MCGPSESSAIDAVPRHLPAAIVPRLVELTRMTPKQVDVTLQLIGLPENSTTHWWKNYDYCENIDDDRGFTVTIFGATSGKQMPAKSLTSASSPTSLDMSHNVEAHCVLS